MILRSTVPVSIIGGLGRVLHLRWHRVTLLCLIGASIVVAVCSAVGSHVWQYGKERLRSRTGVELEVFD